MKTVPNLSPRHLVLQVNPARDGMQTTSLIAETALRSPLYVLAGNDWLPSYALSRLLRHKTVKVKETLGQIQMARAFTCYQLFDLLESMRPTSEPLLVLDFLHTFYNPDIPFSVRGRILNQSINHLKRLWNSRPITVLIQHVQSEDFEYFYSKLVRIADEIIKPEILPTSEKQLTLF